MAEIVEFIYAEQKAGLGQSKSDPVRNVIQLWTKDGRLIAQYDPCDPAQCFYRPYPEATSMQSINVKLNGNVINVGEVLSKATIRPAGY